MKVFYALPVLLAIIFAAQPCAAQAPEADARLMENMAADEDGWAGGEEDGIELPAEPEGEPQFQEEQNPQESLRRVVPHSQDRGAQKLPGR